MIYNFIKNDGNSWDAVEADTDSGIIRKCFIDRELGFAADEGSGVYQTTPAELGFCDMAHLLAYYRDHQRSKFWEVPHHRQRASEIAGLLRLAKHRNDHGNSFDDVPQRLQGYGLSAQYADKIVRYFVFNGIERHNVLVTSDHGDHYDTEINGTLDEIEQFYLGLGATVEFLA